MYNYLEFTPAQSSLADHIERTTGGTGETLLHTISSAREIGSKAEKDELAAQPTTACFADSWQVDTVAWLQAAAAVLRPYGRLAILIGDDSGINTLESITNAAATISQNTSLSYSLHVLASASLSSQATRPWAKQVSRGRGYRREHTILLEKRPGDLASQSIDLAPSQSIDFASGTPPPPSVPPVPPPPPLEPPPAGPMQQLVGIIAGRRMLSKRLAFVDVEPSQVASEPGREGSGKDAGPAKVQVAVRSASAGGEGLPRELLKHELVPGTRISVTGQLRSDARDAVASTLLARELVISHVAPSEQGVASLVDAVHAGLCDATCALGPLTAACASSDDATRAAVDLLARQLVQRTSRSAGVVAIDDKAHQERVRELAELLASASPRRVVDLARSGGGYRHAGLTPGRRVPSLAFLYDDASAADGGRQDGMNSLSLRAKAALKDADEAGGASAAAAAIDTQPALSCRQAAALGAGGGGGALEGSGWVSLEGEVLRRLRIENDVIAQSTNGPTQQGIRPSICAVLLSLGDATVAVDEGGREHDGERSGQGDGKSGGSRQVRCLLHPSMLLRRDQAVGVDGALDEKRLQTFAALAAQGARVRVVGRWAPPSTDSNPSEGDLPRVLLVFAIRLERCSGVLRVVKAALEALADGRLTDAEAVRSLALPASSTPLAASSSHEAASQAAPLLTRDIIAAESRAAKAWRAAELSAALRRADPASALRCAATRSLIDSFAGLRQRFPIRSLPTRTSAVADLATREVQPPTRRSASSASPALVANPTTLQPTGMSGGSESSESYASGSTAAATALLHASNKSSFWNVKKRPQLIVLGEQVRSLLSAHPEWGVRPLRIVDIGGGRGLFAEHLALTFGDAVSVTLVDVVGTRLAQARARMERGTRGVPANLKLLHGDAAALAAVGELESVDVACGMHACGGLSDLIIAHAVQQGAGFVVSTCCFHSNMDLPIPGQTTRDEWLSRTGFRADASKGSSGPTESNEEERRSSLHTLLRTAELTDSPGAAQESAHAINAMRAAAAKASWEATWAGSPLRPKTLSAEVVSYDAKFSARNQIVIGRPDWDET